MNVLIRSLRRLWRGAFLRGRAVHATRSLSGRSNGLRAHWPLDHWPSGQWLNRALRHKLLPAPDFVSSLADFSASVDPDSIVVGSARGSEFCSELSRPLECLRRVTSRERHGSRYVRQASTSCGGKNG